VHCKAFRRLKHKTQVFVAPEGDHYRTRLTHTLEVTTISRTVARALRLNEDLVEAIGLGHDLGHPPFGHIGEEVLDRCLKERFGRDFRHNEHSLRVVEHLERDGAGLNLTEAVRDGIVAHSSRAEMPATLEGRIVRIIDRVAYINHDIDDAIRAGLLRAEDLPAEPIAVLGRDGSARIDALVHDMVEHSQPAGDIAQGPDAGPAMTALREFMFENVYLGPAVRAEHARIATVIERLFEHYVTHPELLPAPARGGERLGANGARAGEGGRDGKDALATRVTDYLAGMTDRFCIRRYLSVADASEEALPSFSL
jgi:dGTPase